MMNPLLLMMLSLGADPPRHSPPPPRPDDDEPEPDTSFRASFECDSEDAVPLSSAIPYLGATSASVIAHTQTSILRRSGPYAPEPRRAVRPIDRACKVCGAAPGESCTNLGKAARKGRTVHANR